MIAIIAVNNLGFIGKNNDLMWKSSEDLKHFKAMTLNTVMVVGYNTYQTLPAVVKSRNTILDNREGLIDPFYQDRQGVLKPVTCIGGKKTYEKYQHLFTELHISHINDNQIGDCTFPDFSRLNPECKIIHHYFEVNGNTSEFDTLKQELAENKQLLTDVQETTVEIIKDSIKGGGTALLIFKQKLEEILRRTVKKGDQKAFDKLVKKYQKNPIEKAIEDKEKVSKAFKEGTPLSETGVKLVHPFEVGPSLKEVEKVLRASIEEVTGEKVNEEDELRTLHDLDLDSLDIVELVMKMEQHFGIEIPDDKIMEVDPFTFKNFANLIHLYVK